MQPLSNDLRKRILEAVDNNEGSRRKLAVRFKVNTATITKLLRLRRETGSIEPRPHAGGVTPTLDDDAAPLRPGPERGAGRVVGPGVVGVGDGDRGAGTGGGPSPAGDRGGGQRPDVPGVRGAGPGAGLASRGRGGLR